MDSLLTPTARLVLFSLEKTPDQTLEEIQRTTGTSSISTLRDAVRSLRIAGKVTKTPKVQGKVSTYSLAA